MKIRLELFSLIAGITMSSYLAAQQVEVIKLRPDIWRSKDIGLYEMKKPDKKVGDITIKLMYMRKDEKPSIMVSIGLKQSLRRDNAFVYLFDINGKRKEIFDVINKGKNKISSRSNAPEDIKRFCETPSKSDLINYPALFNNHLFQFNDKTADIALMFNTAVLGYDTIIPVAFNLYFGKDDLFSGAYIPITLILQIPQEPKPVVVQPVVTEVTPEPVDQGKTDKNAGPPPPPAGKESDAFDMLDQCKKIYFELFELQLAADEKRIDPGILAGYRAMLDEMKFKYDVLLPTIPVTDFKKKRPLNEFYEFYNGAIGITDQLKNQPVVSQTVSALPPPVAKKKASTSAILKNVLIGLSSVLVLAILVLLIIKWKKNTGDKLKKTPKLPRKPKGPTIPQPPQPKPNNIKI